MHKSDTQNATCRCIWHRLSVRSVSVSLSPCCRKSRMSLISPWRGGGHPSPMCIQISRDWEVTQTCLSHEGVTKCCKQMGASNNLPTQPNSSCIDLLQVHIRNAVMSVVSRRHRTWSMWRMVCSVCRLGMSKPAYQVGSCTNGRG